MSDQAEVRQQIEAWATECAKRETKGTLEVFLASVVYQEQYAEGASPEYIAAQVTAAGFPIGKSTIYRRLAVLETLPAAGTPSTETLALFWETYGQTNHPPGGKSETDKNELEDWLHASMALRSQGGDEAIGYAASLLGLPTRQAIHAALHKKGDKDE